MSLSWGVFFICQRGIPLSSHCFGFRVSAKSMISMFVLQVLVQCRINPIANYSIIRYA